MCTARSKYLLVLMAVLLTFTAGATRWYVSANNDPTDPNNPSRGKSWELAFTDLQEALDIAAQGDEIWVAQAAYFPSARHPNDPNDPRRATFLIPAGVMVFGGFRGYDSTDPNVPGETALSQRDPARYPTILDGDLLENDDPDQFPYGSTFADNAYHVVFFHGTDSQFPTKLSGFIIRNGRADGLDEDANPVGEIPDDMGGGILTLWSDDADAYPRLDRLVFSQNYGDVAGAGILVAGKSTTHLANCRFEYNWIGDPNKAGLPDGYGAGLAVSKDVDHDLSTCTVQNAVFFANHIVRGTGAGIYLPLTNTAFPEPAFSNLTFYGNTCAAGPSDPFNPDSLAGAFYRRSGGLPSAWINNCIVWGNTEPQLGDAVDACFCDVEDASYYQGSFAKCSGTNISDDPIFRDPNSGYLMLQHSSPCIDLGALWYNNPNEPNEPNFPLVLDDLTDLDNDGGTTGMIAWEMVYPRPRVLAIPDPNADASRQIDMGAYELAVTCPEDIDGDGVIGLVDLTLLLSVYGRSCSPYFDDPCVCDVDYDGVVALTDLTLLLAVYGGPRPSSLTGGGGSGENSMLGGSDPLTDWLRSATPAEVLRWWYAGMPPVGGNEE